MRNLIIVSLLLASFAGFGQSKTENNNTSEKKGCLKINSIYLNANKYSIQDELFGSENSYHTDFQNFGMNNMHHKNDYYNMGSMMNVSQINIGVGLSPYCKNLGDYNRKQEFRIALSYTHGIRNLTNYSETFPYAGETFISPNAVIISDTLKTKSISTAERLTEIGVDISYIFRTNQDKIVSLFTGVGINTGYAITSDLLTNISYKARIVYNIGGEKIDNGENTSKKEPESTLGSVDPSILIRPYIPFGINFRLAKKHKFFSKMNLYIQGQGGMEYQQLLNGSDYYIKPLMSMGFGIKYTF